MLPEMQTPFVVSCPRSCGWVCPVCHCLAPGSVGLCHPTSDMFSPCDLLNCRMYKVKESLTPFHKRDFVIPVAPFFPPIPGEPPCNSHQLFCCSQHQQPSQQKVNRDSVVRLSQHINSNPHPAAHLSWGH